MRQATADVRRPLRAFLVLQSGWLFGVDPPPARPGGRGRRMRPRICPCPWRPAGLGIACRARQRAGAARHFGEATALLAGDALLALAFTLLGSAEAIGDPYARAELMARLAQACGHSGLVGGQMLETVFADGDGKPSPPLPEISRLQRMKTASLIMFCCESGGDSGPCIGACPARFVRLRTGCGAGVSDRRRSGRRRNREAPTVVSALGVERARAQALALSQQAVRHLDLFDEKADLLARWQRTMRAFWRAFLAG